MTDKFHNTVLRQIADGARYTAVDVFGGPIRSLLDSFQKRARLLTWLHQCRRAPPRWKRPSADVAAAIAVAPVLGADVGA